MLEKVYKLLPWYNNIPDPPYEYDFLINLNESEYPRYLKKIFKTITGENLNLKHPKTFNEKIQWLKLYDCTPLKTQLTDKVLVRDWIKQKIGEEYSKPVLWIGDNFDDIPFEKLPDSFIIKCNHGCKWHFKIKNKEKFLSDKNMYSSINAIFSNWLKQSFFPWAGFELQYKNIKPKLIIESILLNTENNTSEEIEIYCFNGKPKFIQKIKYTIPTTCTVFDENFNETGVSFNSGYTKVNYQADENLKKAFQLSEKLAEEFKLVRIDWLDCKDRIYFNEMTFTPFSGFFNFPDRKTNKIIGNMLDLKK